MLIESDLVSEGLIAGVLSGKHYNRSIASHKIIYEALQRLRFEAFVQTLEDELKEYIQSTVEAAGEAFFGEKLKNFIESEEFAGLIDRYNSFIKESLAASKTFAYWSMYIRMAGKTTELGLKHKTKIDQLGFTHCSFPYQYYLVSHLQAFYYCSFELPDRSIGNFIWQHSGL